jgi:predicted nucleotide-binding protein (sugar kinase/HSP70/actin superfamily)
MVELINDGVSAIACIQPFARLSNHVTGKGMIRELRRRHPGVTVAAIDYDPGASEASELRDDCRAVACERTDDDDHARYRSGFTSRSPRAPM